MRIIYSLSLVALLSACSSAQPDPAPTPAPAPVAAPVPAPAPAPPPRSGNWLDWPIAQGDWVYRSDDRGSLALFGQPGSDATLMIRCDRNTQQIFISQKGTVTADSQMILRASSGLKSFPARNTGGTLSYTAISLQPDEYMLDRIAFSRGRFAVETNDLQSLAIPIWPEFTRVVEDCRS